MFTDRLFIAEIKTIPDEHLALCCYRDGRIKVIGLYNFTDAHVCVDDMFDLKPEDYDEDFDTDLLGESEVFRLYKLAEKELNAE